MLPFSDIELVSLHLSQDIKNSLISVYSQNIVVLNKFTVIYNASGIFTLMEERNQKEKSMFGIRLKNSLISCVVNISLSHVLQALYTS